MNHENPLFATSGKHQLPDQISELPSDPDVDDLLDASSEMSFPASDPISLTAPHDPMRCEKTQRTRP